MTYSDIKQQIADNNLDHFFIFSGPEIEVQKQYINKIAERGNRVIKRIDSVKDAFKFKGLSLLNQSVCYVCRDDPEFQKMAISSDDPMKFLCDKLGENILIYQVSKVDKRSKFYLNWSQHILNFEPMQEPVLIKHIKAVVGLSTENCKALIYICESDYGRILSEIDKIQNYKIAKDSKITDDMAFQELINQGAIYQPPDDAIFDWVDAVLSGKPRKAFELWQECVDIGEPSLRLLLVLYQGVKRLLQVQSCESKEICKVTGLSQWEVNLVKDYIGIYHTGELVAALRYIQELETGIKTGQIEEEFTVPYAMIQLIGG